MILKVCLVVFLVTIIGLVVFQFIDPNLSGGQDDTTLVDDSSTFKIGISGEVEKPGDYVFSTKSVMLEDLIVAAGGSNSNSDERCYNLDHELKNGLNYYIAPRYDEADVCGDTEIFKININEAEAEELTKISGFGESIAKAIVTYRESNGQFYCLEDIKNVSGIGEAKYLSSRDYVYLHD
jgi:competence protein ComEA